MARHRLCSTFWKTKNKTKNKLRSISLSWYEGLADKSQSSFTIALIKNKQTKSQTQYLKDITESNCAKEHGSNLTRSSM